MGRPSTKKQRTEEILNAYERCVARFGVEGATLERVASDAGLARPLIRHNIGNRDALLEALTNRFLEKSSRAMDALIESLPKDKPSETLIDRLFDDSYTDPTLVLVTEALIAAAQERPELAERMTAWVDRYCGVIADILKAEFPDCPNERTTAVATGLIGLYFTVDSFTPLGGIRGFRHASRDAALLLVDSLGQAGKERKPS